MAVILASLLFASVSAPVGGTVDVEDWTRSTPRAEDIFVPPGNQDFLSDLISGGGTLGTVRIPPRLEGRDVLSHRKRSTLRSYLEANPGANFGMIRRDLGMAVGTLAYHLWVLETGNVIQSWREGRLRCYALSEYRGADERPKLTDIEHILLTNIRRSPDITQRELAQEVGVSQPAISYHITRMTELGVVHVERQGLHRRYSVTLDGLLRGR